MLNRLKKYEEEYCRNTYCGNSEGGDFRFEDRGSRLILTAPHAVRTLRDNRPKAPDLCTGALTRLAGEQNDVSTIIRHRTGEERNAAAGFVIDRQLANHCFLDIHGMSGGREFELAVGTGILPAADYAPELELIATIQVKMRVLPRGGEEKVLAIGQKAAYFSRSRHFVNLVQGEGLYGFDGIRRTAELMMDAYRNEKDTERLVIQKGWGCECCL